MCFVDIDKAFDRVPRKVMEWAMRKKGLPEVIKSVDESISRGKNESSSGIRVISEILGTSWYTSRIWLLPLLFGIAEDVISENAREGLMNEILYVDDLILMSESMNLKEKFFKWKETFESKGLKVNLKKTKVLLSGLKGEALKSKVDPCAQCDKKVMENLVKCTKCSKWVHDRCAKMKRVTSPLAKGFVCELCVYTKELRNQVKNYYHFLTRLTL